MKHYIWIIFIFVFFSCKVKNEYPDKLTIKQIIDPILQKKYGDDVLTDTTNKINYFKGHFTNKEKDECLVMLSSINTWGHIYVRPLLLFENSKNEWKFSNWYNLDADSVLVIDINNDKINEIFLSFTSFSTGRLFLDQKLISLKDQKEKILYKSESIDDFMSKDPMVWKYNDTISNIYEIQFVDNENDGKKEIIEKRSIGFRDKVIKDSLIEKYTESTKIINIK